MASDREIVKFVCEQLCGAGDIASRRVFGEAAVYLQDKVIGLVCDNQFFVNATDLVRTTAAALPNPKAKAKKIRRAKQKTPCRNQSPEA